MVDGPDRTTTEPLTFPLSEVPASERHSSTGVGREILAGIQTVNLARNISRARLVCICGSAKQRHQKREK